MTNRILIMLIVIELIGAATVANHRRMRALPPGFNAKLVDDLTAAELEQARQRLIIAVKQGHAGANSWKSLADAYAAHGYFREAAAMYLHASSLAPRDAEIVFRLAFCLDRVARYDEAIAAFDKTASLADRALRRQDCDYFVGRIHLKLEQHDLAEKRFRNCPDHVPAKYELANLMIRTGRVDEADPFLKALGSHKRSFWSHLIRASAAEARGEFEKAAQHYDAAERGDDIPFFMTDRGVFNTVRAQHGASRMRSEGYALAEQGQLPAALVQFDKAFAADYVERLVPDHAELTMAVKGPEEGRRVINELIDRAGATADYLEILGDTWMNDGHADRAVATWNRSAAMLSSYTVHEKLADYYRRQGEDTKARRHQGEALYKRGFLAYRANDLENALDAFERAAELIPDHPHTWYFLGQVFHAMGKKQKAIGALEKCLAIDLSHGRARQLLHRLKDQLNKE